MDSRNNFRSLSYELCTEAVKYVGVGIRPGESQLGQLAQARKFFLGESYRLQRCPIAQKYMFFSVLLPQTLTQHRKPPPPLPMTTGDRHKLSLLAIEPPQGEEHFNQRGIFIIQLKDSAENIALNPSFVVSSR